MMQTDLYAQRMKQSRARPGFRKGLAAGFLAASCVVAMLTKVSVIFPLPAARFAAPPGASQQIATKLLVTCDPKTAYAGKIVNVNMGLRDQNGKPMKADEAIPLTITITTLDDLKSAKALNPTPVRMQEDWKATLRNDQNVVQYLSFFPKEKDQHIRFTSQQTGRLRIFVEGKNMKPAEALLVVLPRTSRLLRRPPTASLASPTDRYDNVPLQSGSLIPVIWRQEGAPSISPSLALEVVPPGTDPDTEGAEMVVPVSVELHSAYDRSMYVQARRLIKVNLRVVGNAWFKPNQITIPAGESISEPAELRARAEGDFAVTAASPPIGATYFKSDTRPITIQQGKHSDKLSLTPRQGSAMANGLDEIIIEVRAIQLKAGDSPVLIRIEDESKEMEARTVSFRVSESGTGLRFENGGQTEIPRGQYFATIRLYGTRPISGAQIVAESTTGSSKSIQSDPLAVSFYFPWMQLICAIIGGICSLLDTETPICKICARRAVSRGLLWSHII
jgi:hypothetical protein